MCICYIFLRLCINIEQREFLASIDCRFVHHVTPWMSYFLTSVVTINTFCQSSIIKSVPYQDRGIRNRTKTSPRIQQNTKDHHYTYIDHTPFRYNAQLSTRTKKKKAPERRFSFHRDKEKPTCGARIYLMVYRRKFFTMSFMVYPHHSICKFNILRCFPIVLPLTL